MKYRKMGLKTNPVKTALVLSGGGAKGAYQAGVIKELMARDIQLDLVTGSSIGSFNGALLAECLNLNLSSEQIAERLTGVWLEVGDFLNLNWQGFISNFCSPTNISSVFSNKKVKELIYNYIPEGRLFSDYTRCQLSITGTNLNRKTLQVFDFNSCVPVREALLASMSYPVAFPSVKIDSDYYIDGGALDNAPLKEAILWGARNIYIVFLQPLYLIEGGQREDHKQYTALDVIEELIDLAANRLMYGDLKKANKINQLIKILNTYNDQLPEGFLKEIKRLFGLKYGQGKRFIQIRKIAPVDVLEPPGTMGFDNQKAIKKIMELGENDARKWLVS